MSARTTVNIEILGIENLRMPPGSGQRFTAQIRENPAPTNLPKQSRIDPHGATPIRQHSNRPEMEFFPLITS
jgi:hypothetical protein